MSTLVKYLDFLSYILSARIVNKACRQDYIRRHMHILHTRIYFLEVYSERHPVGFLWQHTKCRSPIMHLPTALPSISTVNTACFKGMTITILTGETQSARTHGLVLCVSGLSAQWTCGSILFLFLLGASIQSHFAKPSLVPVPAQAILAGVSVSNFRNGPCWII